MKKQYKLLWAIIKSEGLTYEDVAEELDRSTGYVGERFRGACSFTLNEAYQILEWLDLPESEIYRYFPPPEAASKSITQVLKTAGG